MRLEDVIEVRGIFDATCREKEEPLVAGVRALMANGPVEIRPVGEGADVAKERAKAMGSLLDGECLVFTAPAEHNRRSAAAILGALAIMAGDGLPGLMPRGTGNQNRRNHYCGADANGGKPIEAPDRPGRNSRCPCGSGKKFKACCLKGD